MYSFRLAGEKPAPTCQLFQLTLLRELKYYAMVLRHNMVLMLLQGL